MRKTLKWLAITLGGLALLFYAGGGWYFSSLLDERALDTEERLSELEPTFEYRVAAITADLISLEVPQDPGNLHRPGVWGVEWPQGYGLAGDIDEQGSDLVTRRFQVVLGDSPAVGSMVAFETMALPDVPDGALDPAPVEITYPGPLGEYPAWWFPGEGSSWVILVHGNGLQIADHAKLVPALHEAGFPVLAIAYRNAPGAPLDPSGKLQYGVTEWADVEAAVNYAVGEGAESVALVGASMGGAAVTRFLYDSSTAGTVTAVVLEAPMLDFGRTVDLNAAQEDLPLVGLAVPQSLTTVAKWLASLRFGVDWGQMDLISRADELTHPVLIFHGTDDTRVPIATSQDFAAARPELVTLVEVDDAPHMGAWNVDPAAFERRLVEFLGVGGD